MAVKPDKKDLQILFELDRDCRQSFNEIAHKTRLSRDVVRYRISRLETEGYVTGYISIIDFTRLGFHIVRLYLKLQNTTEKIEDEMIKYLMQQEAVIVAYRTDGNFEIALGLLVKDLRHYQEVYENLLGKYRSYIVEKNFSVFQDYIQYFRNYLVEDKSWDYKELSTGSHQQFQYDKTDILLLKEIATSARASLVDLAKKLKMPVTTVKYRLRNLEKNGVIVAYRAIINYTKLGYEYYKVDLVIEDLSIIPSLQEFIRRHPNIIYRDITIGGSDFEFDCELPNQQEFYKLIETIRNMYPKKIRSYFYYKAIYIYKYSYFPNLLLKEVNVK